MNLVKYDSKGKKLSTEVKVDDSVFGAEVNEDLLSQYVFVYLSNQRQSNAHTKDRGDVSGGGKKPFKQKGTGRARAGSNRSPIWVGGGVTFGPTNMRNWKKDMTKKMKKQAMVSALSYIASDNKAVVVEDLKPSKTKDMVEFVRATGIEKKITLLHEGNVELVKAVRNIPNVDIKTLADVNAYDILNSGTLMISESIVDQLVKKFSK